jgi:heme/copper-type cytochrome/quinol oxidase subunit 2
VTKLAIAVLRMTQAAFAICTIAAIVDNVMPVAFITGVLFVLVGSFIAWCRWDARMRKWDSEYPAPVDQAETLPEFADEPSRTRRIVPARSDDKRGAA